jgi:hypothetical protein
MAKQEAQGYEVAGYSEPVLDAAQAYKVVKQIMLDWRNERGNAATQSCWADMTGDQLKLHYHGYEMMLPTRVAQAQDRAKQMLDEALRLLKKEFKERTGSALTLKENKELADYSIQKLSLNERYEFKSWRFYTLSF